MTDVPNTPLYLVAKQHFDRDCNMATATATATAGPIPLVNNVVTDEDFENLRADGKVTSLIIQRIELLLRNVM